MKNKPLLVDASSCKRASCHSLHARALAAATTNRHQACVLAQGLPSVASMLLTLKIASQAKTLFVHYQVGWAAGSMPLLPRPLAVPGSMTTQQLLQLLPTAASPQPWPNHYVPCPMPHAATTRQQATITPASPAPVPAAWPWPAPRTAPAAAAAHPPPHQQPPTAAATPPHAAAAADAPRQ